MAVAASVACESEIISVTDANPYSLQLFVAPRRAHRADGKELNFGLRRALNDWPQSFLFYTEQSLPILAFPETHVKTIPSIPFIFAVNKVLLIFFRRQWRVRRPQPILQRHHNGRHAVEDAAEEADNQARATQETAERTIHPAEEEEEAPEKAEDEDLAVAGNPTVATQTSRRLRMKLRYKTKSLA